MAALALTSFGGPARAADAASTAALAKQLTHVKDVLRGQEKPDELFERFFKEFFFVQFTTPSKVDVPRLRRDLRNFFITCHSSDAYQALSKMTIEEMKKIIVRKYKKPDEYAIKYNALLAIAELNEDPEQGGKNKPSATAFSLLLYVLESPKFPEDYAKVAALYGIERNAAANTIPKDKVAKVNSILLKMIEQKEPPAGRDAAANQYLRRSAAQILALIGDPGNDNSNVKAIEAVAADPAAKPTMRCEMAQFLGDFKYPKGAERDVQQLAWMATRLAIDICKQELAAAESASRPPSRRMIVYAIDSAMRTLAGEGRSGLSASVSGTATQKSINTIYQKLKSINTDLEKSETSDDALGPEITSKLTELETLLTSQERERGQTANAR